MYRNKNRKICQTAAIPACDNIKLREHFPRLASNKTVGFLPNHYGENDERVHAPKENWHLENEEKLYRSQNKSFSAAQPIV